MDEQMNELIKMIVAVLPFVFVAFLSIGNNLPKSERSKQYSMPVIALVFTIVSMLSMDGITQSIIDFINNIPVWLVQLSQESWMPEAWAPKIVELSVQTEQYFKEIDIVFWVFFIANTLVFLIYLGVKEIALKIISKVVKSHGALHRNIAERFYEFFWEKNKWCLQDNYAQARDLLKFFYLSVVLISSGLMIFSRKFYYEGIFNTVFFPVYGVILVGELYFYLDGATKTEYSNDILGENENAYKTVNYSLLRKYLRDVFGDKILAENTSINNNLGYDYTTEDIIRDIEKDEEDQKILNFTTYFRALHKTGFTIDHNYLYSSMDMLKGKSVLFNNPFYNDLIPYAFYPMNRALLSHKKVLVVLGRHSIEEDVMHWVENGIDAVTNIPALWKTKILTSEYEECDIGIITRSDVFNIGLHNANGEFFEKVGFVVIIEPSKLITTAQIGLNMIVKKCRVEEDKDITFCMCDKNCDGLVDAMSHVLMTNITEVSATNKHKGTSSYICWNADEEYLHHRLLPNISHYLGVGTELSFAALKNQVSKTIWYGGETFPITDMRWINRQYYFDLAKYASIPTTQEALDEHFETNPNFWSAVVKKNAYITVEDEFYNMFETLRDFSSRTTEQGFINVIASEYLMKDYMVENASIFETDAKAIPCIVADYVRSNRNTILRLILMMATYHVSSETLEKELSIIDIDVFSLRMQLWYEIYKFYAPASEVALLPVDYRQTVEEAYEKKFSIGSLEVTREILRVTEEFNMDKGKMEMVFSIEDEDFLKACVHELRSAGYIVEDERGEKYYLGSEMGGHIYQKLLPGQFFTFGGKYYEMQYITPDNQVLVRRAADHINGRPSYRQVRKYSISGIIASEKIGSQINAGGLKVIKEFADISVETPGYYRMGRYNDFANAKYISFEESATGIPSRVYRNKEILRLEFPDADSKFTNSVRYTITLLLNELFRTLFAENAAYICALTDLSFIDENKDKKPITYFINGEDEKYSSNAIYIIEDSQLDLGMLVAFERNLQRIFGMIHDYIEWHSETLENSLNPEENDGGDVGTPIVLSEEEDDKKKDGIFRRLKERISKLFKRKKKEKPSEKKETEEDSKSGDPSEGEKEKEPDENDAEPLELDNIADNEFADNEEETDNSESDGTEEKLEFLENDESFDNADGSENIEPPKATDDTEGEENRLDVIISETVDESEMPEPYEDIFVIDVEETNMDLTGRNKPYHERYYLLYGADSEPEFINLTGTLGYLDKIGLEINSLKQAREGVDTAETMGTNFVPGKPDARYCDFCGNEIYGVEFETLADGRDRCAGCSKTAIKTENEFRELFEEVKRNIESFFGVRVNAGIRVEMVNSQTLHKKLGQAFIPTSSNDGRILGVAIKKKDQYTLMIENGAPRLASMLTIAHELTHIWQYINWDDKRIKKKYGKKMRLEIYEGMAKWVEIQYAYLINEPGAAKREEILTAYRNDEYGRGFLRYRENYPFSKGTFITGITPFFDKETPLAPEYCGSITVRMPVTGTNAGDIENIRRKKKKKGNKTVKKPAPQGTNFRNPEMLNRYAYSILSDTEKTLYDAVFAAISDFTTEISVANYNVGVETVHKTVRHIHCDHPEIFWFNYGHSIYYDKMTNIVEKISFRYCMTKEERDARCEKIEAETSRFLAEINDDMSDYDVALKVYENIIKLVDYDTIGLEKQKNEEVTPETPDDLRSVYGVFVNKKAVCAGYSKAMQYLAQLCGIECIYVTSKTHAWNIIKLEGDYYHLDVTWGDGSNTRKEQSNPEHIDYGCFCITTEDVLKLQNHTPTDEILLPECTATKCNYFVRNGLYFEKFEFSEVRDVICERLGCGIIEVPLKFADKTAYAAAEDAFITKKKIREIIQYTNLKTEVKVGTSYSYSTSEEKLVISLFFNKI